MPMRTSGGAVAAERALRDALHLLRDGLCAVCRERDDGARSWLAYFVDDSNSEESVRARLRAAVGFCPAHTRQLLAGTSAPWLMPRVHAEALAGGLRLLSDGGRLGPCPACEAGEAAAQRAVTGILRALGEPPVREALREGALCLPHTATLAAQAETATDVQAEALPVARLAGLDPDAAPRARHQERLDPLLEAERARQRDAVAERWDADARLACCPLCLAGHRAARRLLRWAATTTGSGHPTPEETGLCPRHLHDLDAVGGPNVPALLAANAEAWRARLARFGREAGRGGGRAGRRAAAARLLAPGRCRACEEERTAHARQAALLAAALHDPVRARAYEHAHGVCLHHALATGEGPPPPEAAMVVLRARLALLDWELTEALRKQDWRTRHEVKGAEMAVGARAPTLLDGRVYAGVPAPNGEHAHEEEEAEAGEAVAEAEAEEDTTARRPRWSST
jgi:hypothetical protein